MVSRETLYFMAIYRDSSSFGTRGSQVQILPLRPMFAVVFVDSPEPEAQKRAQQQLKPIFKNNYEPAVLIFSVVPTIVTLFDKHKIILICI
jgi:hypothetical protein